MQSDAVENSLPGNRSERRRKRRAARRPLQEGIKKVPGLTRRGNSNDIAFGPIVPIPALRREAGTKERAERVANRGTRGWKLQVVMGWTGV